MGILKSIKKIVKAATPVLTTGSLNPLDHVKSFGALTGIIKSDPADYLTTAKLQTEGFGMTRNQGERDRFSELSERRSKIKAIKDPNADDSENRKKAAKRRKTGRAGTMLTNREGLG